MEVMDLHMPLIVNTMCLQLPQAQLMFSLYKYDVADSQLIFTVVCLFCILFLQFSLKFFDFKFQLF